MKFSFDINEAQRRHSRKRIKISASSRNIEINEPIRRIIVQLICAVATTDGIFFNNKTIISFDACAFDVWTSFTARTCKCTIHVKPVH